MFVLTFVFTSSLLGFNVLFAHKKKYSKKNSSITYQEKSLGKSYKRFGINYKKRLSRFGRIKKYFRSCYEHVKNHGFSQSMFIAALQASFKGFITQEEHGLICAEFTRLVDLFNEQRDALLKQVKGHRKKVLTSAQANYLLMSAKDSFCECLSGFFNSLSPGDYRKRVCAYRYKYSDTSVLDQRFDWIKL